MTPKGTPCGTFDQWVPQWNYYYEHYWVVNDWVVSYFRSYSVQFTTNPPGRNPCQALAEVTAEFNRFASTFLTNDDVCPESRRLKVWTILLGTKVLPNSNSQVSVFIYFFSWKIEWRPGSENLSAEPIVILTNTEKVRVIHKYIGIWSTATWLTPWYRLLFMINLIKRLFKSLLWNW